MNIKAWIEATRLRTLPVSVAGVIAGCAYAILADSFSWAPAILCLLVALLAQISSNFANEYYDYKAGLDKPGREGPRRGVTEGDITPRAMAIATFATLGAACCCGFALLFWGPWWLICVGVCVALGVIAYSAGPYPLSRHALGEVAVAFFFGIIPVTFTFYVQSGFFDITVIAGSLAIGLMGANVLIVNNYRDADDDAAVGKRTFAVKFGRTAASTLYLFNGYVAIALMSPLWLIFPWLWWLIPIGYLSAHTMLWLAIQRRRGAALNPFLGITAMLLLAYCVAFLVAAACF